MFLRYVFNIAVYYTDRLVKSKLLHRLTTQCDVTVTITVWDNRIRSRLLLITDPTITLTLLILLTVLTLTITVATSSVLSGRLTVCIYLTCAEKLTDI